jgi:hypothetical protein
VKNEVSGFWVVTPCSDVVAYQSFRGSCSLHLHPKDGDSIVLRNAGILLQHYMESQPEDRDLKAGIFANMLLLLHVKVLTINTEIRLVWNSSDIADWNTIHKSLHLQKKM